MLPIDLRPEFPDMKRVFDNFTEFSVFTDTDTYCMVFYNALTFHEMLEFMIDHYSIDIDSIVKVCNCHVSYY